MSPVARRLCLHIFALNVCAVVGFSLGLCGGSSHAMADNRDLLPGVIGGAAEERSVYVLPNESDADAYAGLDLSIEPFFRSGREDMPWDASINERRDQMRQSFNSRINENAALHAEEQIRAFDRAAEDMKKEQRALARERQRLESAYMWDSWNNRDRYYGCRDWGHYRGFHC